MTGKSIGILFAVLLLGGAGVWWLMVSPTQDMAVSDVDTVEPATEDSALPTGRGTLAELFMSGQPLECQFTFADEGYMGEGTSFVDGEQMRVSAMMQQDGSMFTSDYIVTNSTIYMWAETPEGFFAVTMPADEDSEVSEAEDEFLSMDDEVSYECQPWSVDASVFVPPADVEFMDMGAMMQGMMEGFEGMNQAEIEAMMEEGFMSPQ